MNGKSPSCGVALLLRGVYVRLNRVTDKDNVAKGMMTQLPTTDIWHLDASLTVASYCGSYTMVEIPPETPDETVLCSLKPFRLPTGRRTH